MWMLHIVFYAQLYSLASICIHACPEKCVCEESGSVQCFRVQTIPQGITSEVRRLNLGYNHIEEIKGKDLSGLPALEEVILSSCGVEQLEANAFRSQRLLRNLDLRKNKLCYIPRSLPTSLESLHLGHNRIHALQEPVLKGLKRLRVLNLQNNLITTLRTNTLSALIKLEALHLDGNKINTLRGGLKLPGLNWFSLAGNQVSSLPSGFFSSMQLLKTLDLSSNLLTRVPTNLPSALIHLNLNRNQIRTLKSHDMAHLHNMSTLSASYNRLASWDSSLRLPNLTVLELAGNQLRMLPNRISDQLKKLDFGQNHVTEVSHQQLTGLRRLKHLFLENNFIQHFEPDALRDCGHLSSLALEQNLLSSIPHGLPESLVRLDLKCNHIVVIQEDELESLKQLQVLNLRNNTLSSLPAMNLLPKLKTLYLDGNPWNCSCGLLKVKRALLARAVVINPDICTEPIHQSMDIWQAYKMAKEECEVKNEEKIQESQSEHASNEDYYDYDF